MIMIVSWIQSVRYRQIGNKSLKKWLRNEMLVYEIKPLLEIHIFPHFPNNSFCEVKPFLHIWNPCFDNFYPIFIILMKLCYGHLDHWLNTKSPAVELRFAAELWNSRVLVQFFSSVQFSATLLLSHSAMLRHATLCGRVYCVLYPYKCSHLRSFLQQCSPTVQWRSTT